MKKIYLKRVISFVLIFVMLLSTTIVCAYATENKNENSFKNIEELRTTVLQIFDDNFEEFVSRARELRPSIEFEDKYITQDRNCGPCTTAFQEIMYKNGMIIEAQRANFKLDHTFDFMRTIFTDTPDKVSCIVIDTTYKQFLGETYLNACYTRDDLNSDVPEVLVYEYGNYEQLKEQLTGIKERFGEEIYEDLCEEVYFWEYSYQYLAQDLQYFDYKNNGVIKYTPAHMDEFANEIGKYEVKMTDIPVLNSTTTEAQISFEYDNNGVYRCVIPSAEFSKYTGGFNIVNTENKVLFGAKEEYSRVNPAVQYIYNASPDDIKLLKKDGEYPISINTSGPYQVWSDVMVCIDMRAGEETPALYVLPIYKKQLYGDVNSDGTVNVTDATAIQKVLAGLDGESFDSFESDAANVLKDKELSVSCATAISKYIVGLGDSKCGQSLYYSQRIQLGSTPNFGYVDF